MGQDYSYSQPSSSSDSLDITSLLQAEAQMYADEADSSDCNAKPVQYEPQPEGDDGIPRTCYCGAMPVIGCSYTPKDPYRRYFTCHNVDDGDCHVWKWWDHKVMLLIIVAILVCLVCYIYRTLKHPPSRICGTPRGPPL